MAWHPRAERNNIRPGSNDPAIIPVGFILHVAVSEAWSIRPIFENLNGIESHFYVRRDGSFEQYRNTGYEADANYKANSFVRGGKRYGYISIETQGMGDGEWTPEQVATIKDILAWGRAEHGIRLEKATGPYSGGVGYHTQFPWIWTPVAKSCPGHDRIRQFDNEIVPWMNAGGKGNTLSWNEDIANWSPDDGAHGQMHAGQQLNQARGYSEDTYQRVKRLENAFRVFAKSLPDTVREAFEEALNSDISAEVTVNVEEK